jgi:hypothetical protein
MSGIDTGLARWVTALACSCMLLPAWASPPFSRPASRVASSHPPYLDLRPLSARELAGVPAAPADRPSWGRPRTPGSRESNLPALEADASDARVMSRAESFVRRVHREGLPVARLWENHSALVSLGLNAKGKPGLWLVQKTR